MTAYIIGEIEVTDPNGFEEYRARVPAIIAAFAGSYLIRGGEMTVLEGQWQPKRFVVLEFPNMTALQNFWNSAEYAPLRDLRERTTNSRLIAVEGYSP